jgi:hypothetical protein
MKAILSIVLALTLVLSGCELIKKPSPEVVTVPVEHNLVYSWAELALDATAKDTQRFRPRPTITSRYLGLIFTSMFDAWSRYDSTSTPVYLSDVERRPASERTQRNKEIALSYAAFRTMSEYYFSDSLLFRQFMIDHGFDPDNRTMDPAKPEGVGNLAANAVIEARRNDGSNQYGDESGSNSTAYFDYTQYIPVNNVDVNVDINRWQPKYFADGYGGKWASPCLTPYWQHVKPIALTSADMFRPGPPPAFGTEELERQLEEVVTMQANLTDEQKALVEFMRDGPKSVQQAGHWLKFAQTVSARDHHTIDDDVKMYFLVELAAMDAFIACWDTKMFYDSARPYALIHAQYKDKRIKGWGGENHGIMEIPGEAWRPYSPETFICPPFPSYVSGHSTASGACGEVLRLFTGSDVFGEKVTIVAGAMTEPGYKGEIINLEFTTFTQAAEEAGLSRVLGGYHIQSDNIEGLRLGRNVANEVWKFYLRHTEAQEVTAENQGAVTASSPK